MKKIQYFPDSSWTLDSRITATCEQNIYVISKRNVVEAVNSESKRIATYAGSIGVDPASRFGPLDMTVDSKGNVLLAKPNDNAIHLLDKSLKFQRLLLTGEDGLTGPRSVTLDPSGYLWVGCSDGQIRVFNYQYLMCTDRKSRYLHSA